MPRRRPAEPARACSAASNHGGWDPNEKNFHLYTIVIGAQTLHATGYAMGIAARRPRTSRGDRLLRRRRVLPGRRERGVRLRRVYNAPVVFFCQNNQWAISEPNERADPRAALPARRRLRLPGRPGRRQRRPRRAYAVTKAALERARTGNGPDADRGVHLPDGRAHHLRRPDAATATRDEVEEWKAKDPIAAAARVPGHAGLRRRRRSSTRRRRGRRRSPPTCASALPGDARPGPAVDVRPRLRRAAPAGATSSAHEFAALPGHRFDGGGALMAERPTDADRIGQGAQHRPAPRDGGRPEGPAHGRGHRQARRRLPGHRRPAEGLRRGPRHRHPARRVRHRRHRDRPGPARLPAGVRDPVRRLRLPGLRPDRLASSPRCTPARRARCSMPIVIRIPFGGGIGAVEHHSRVARGATSRTPPACASSPARTRSTPTG